MGRLPDSGLPQDRAGRACRAGDDPVRLPDARRAGFPTPGSPPRSTRPTASTAISTRCRAGSRRSAPGPLSANRPDWLADPEHWQGITREVENKLSDALHERLTERFVDRRTSVLMRRLRENSDFEYRNRQDRRSDRRRPCDRPARRIHLCARRGGGRLRRQGVAGDRAEGAGRRDRRARRETGRRARRSVRADLRRHHPLDRRCGGETGRGRRRAASAHPHHFRRAPDRRAARGGADAARSVAEDAYRKAAGAAVRPRQGRGHHRHRARHRVPADRGARRAGARRRSRPR